MARLYAAAGACSVCVASGNSYRRTRFTSPGPSARRLKVASDVLRCILMRTVARRRRTMMAGPAVMTGPYLMSA
jgi:hypothetical protein